MTTDDIGAVIHNLTPHSATSLYIFDVAAALIALAWVYGSCWWHKSHRHLPTAWIISIVAGAAPVPTWLLMLLMPLDHDLGNTIGMDPIVVALASLYALHAAFRDIRRMTKSATNRKSNGEPPTED